MYSILKKIIKACIPKRFLFRYEPFFRLCYGVFYLGNKHQCNICSKKLKSFIVLNNNDLLCPFCGSLSRTRRLWSQLNQNNHINGQLLHFSPARCLYRKLKQIDGINYFSTDFGGEFLADYSFDITDIEQEDEKFDVIICYHILEHIFDDRKAISELYRVLKPNGKIYVQTPFKGGEIYENPSIVSLEERKIHFGQEDHVRVYSIDGLKKRLEATGFKVVVKTFNSLDNDKYYGLISPETVIISTKIAV